MHEIRAERTTFAFRPDAEPVLRVEPGATVRFHTSPEPAERLFAAGDRWLSVLDVTRINAVTGPVFIEGAEPGDAVSVEILDIQAGDWGWCAAIPGFGLLGDAMPTPVLRRLPIVDEQIVVSNRLSLSVQPMIGCLGLAPKTGQSSTLAPPYPWGGNYDLTQVSPGNTILFPVQVTGGLFSLGDLHAAMGIGEAASIGIEMPGSATVRLGVRHGLRLETPRIETPDRLYTIGLRKKSDYSAARRQAIDLMFAYLTRERGLASADAYVLCAASVDLSFGGPAAAVVLASVELASIGL